MTRRRGRTLAEASPAVGRLLEQAKMRAPGVVTSSDAVSSPPRHCWVVDPPDCPGRWAGVLLEWRTDQDGRSGRVVYVVIDDGQAVKVSAWVPAEHLRPA